MLVEIEYTRALMWEAWGGRGGWGRDGTYRDHELIHLSGSRGIGPPVGVEGICVGSEQVGGAVDDPGVYA